MSDRLAVAAAVIGWASVEFLIVLLAVGLSA
jgi:hypothetical protein